MRLGYKLGYSEPVKIYIGADHRGYELKNHLTRYLEREKISVQDVGAFTLDPKDDYTLYAQKVASLVSSHPEDLGILLCGSGVGVDVTANKFDKVRASIGLSPEQVTAGRAHDDMNVLVIAADFTKEHAAQQLVHSFIHTSFDALKRHKDRLLEIERIEENN